MSKRKVKFVINEQADGEFNVAIIAGNGEHWFKSEGYYSVSNAKRSIHKFIKRIPELLNDYNTDSDESLNESIDINISVVDYIKKGGEDDSKKS